MIPARLIETSSHINENLTSPSIDTKGSICQLKMTIEEPAKFENQEPIRRHITMDLPPATLDTLIEDFTKIREQLANVAKK